MQTHEQLPGRSCCKWKKTDERRDDRHTKTSATFKYGTGQTLIKTQIHFYYFWISFSDGFHYEVFSPEDERHFFCPCSILNLRDSKVNSNTDNYKVRPLLFTLFLLKTLHK